LAIGRPERDLSSSARLDRPWRSRPDDDRLLRELDRTRFARQIDVNDPPASLEMDEAEFISSEGTPAAARYENFGPITREDDSCLIDQSRSIRRAPRCVIGCRRGSERPHWLGAEPGGREQSLGRGMVSDHLRRQDIAGQRLPILVGEAEVECPERAAQLSLSRITLSEWLLCNCGSRPNHQHPEQHNASPNNSAVSSHRPARSSHDALRNVRLMR